MAFQPLTYRGQYPPFTPRSPSDISSFTQLHTSLRALPELAREGEKILNEEMLAKLVDGMNRFQHDHLGRNAKSKYWPTTRLPSQILTDRSSYPNGPLSIAILSAFRIKQTSHWRNFNFDNPKLFDDNISILKKMRGDLYDKGFLKRICIYFDKSVGSAEVVRLGKIAVRFGATVVEDAGEVGKGRVTHIVAFDPEEHDSDEVVREEDRREKSGEEMEKTYLKTVAIVDQPVHETAAAAAAAGGTTANATTTKKKMALVHWWYHPSSHDEWMSAEDVSGEIETDEHPGIPGGPAVVGCKFIRDVERFNEWGVEADYAVMEYERKIAYLQKQPTKSSSSSKKSKKSSKSKGGKSKQKNDPVMETTAPLLDNHTITSTLQEEEQPAAKKMKTTDNNEDNVTTASSSAAAVADVSNNVLPVTNPSPTSSPSKKKKSSSKSSSSTTNNNTNTTSITPATDTSQSVRQRSDRRRPENRTGGMHPRRILTGMRGLRNEVIRRTVYDGALRVEEEPYKIVQDALGDYLNGSGVGLQKSEKQVQVHQPPTLNARPEWRKLLPPTGFVRPSVDSALTSMTVTELTVSDDGPTEQVNAMGEAVMVLPKTCAVNCAIPILVPPEVVAGGGGEGEGPASIRGGGEGEMAPDGVAGETFGELVQQQPVDIGGEEPSNVPIASTEGNNGLEPVQLTTTPAPAVAEVDAPASTPCDNPVVTEGGDNTTMPLAAGSEGANDSNVANAGEHAPPVVSIENDMQVDEAPLAVAPAPAVAEEIWKEEPTKDATTDQPGEGHATMEFDQLSQETSTKVEKTEAIVEEIVAPSAPPATIAEAEKTDATVEETAVPSAPTEAAPSAPLTEQAETAASSGAPEAGGMEALASQTSATKPMEVDPPAVENLAEASSGEVKEVQVETSTAPTTASSKDEMNVDASGDIATDKPTSEVSMEVSAAATSAAPSATHPSTSQEVQVISSNTPAPTTAISNPPHPAETQTVVAAIPQPAQPAVPAQGVQAPTVQSTPSHPLSETNATSSAQDPAQAVASSVQASTTASQPPTAPEVKPQPAAAVAVTKVVSLPAATHLTTSLYRPSTASTEEESKTASLPRPSWYNSTAQSSLEERSLPEWFNASAPHRTPATYISTRECMLDLAKRHPQQYITSTAIRRSVPGDAGSLMRLHKFLMDWGMLNTSQIGETAPSEGALRGVGSSASASEKKRKYAKMEKAHVWTSERMQALEMAVVKNCVSKQATDESGNASQESTMEVDWEVVANNVGGGVTVADCQRAFIDPPSTENVQGMNSATISQILDGVPPEVFKATIGASLASTQDISQSRKSAFIATLASAAVTKAAEAENEIETSMMDIIDQRMQRLENRVALLDDVEALLEAERVSLELERRDMYTSRCRHWFGDGSS